MIQQLHTKSSYGEQNISFEWYTKAQAHQNNNFEISRAIAQEKNLYKLFGASTYKDFKTQIQETLCTNENDRQAFIRMTNTQITPIIMNYFGLEKGVFEEQEIIIDITATAAFTKFGDISAASQYLNKVLESIKTTRGAFLDVEIKGNKIVFPKTLWGRNNIDLSHKLIFQQPKQVTNKTTGKKEWDTHVAKKASDVTNKVERDMLRELEGEKIEEVLAAPVPANKPILNIYKQYYQEIKKENEGILFPEHGMRSNKNDLKLLKETDPAQFNQLMIEIKETIKKFIGYSETTNEYFKPAFNKVWEQNFADGYWFWSRGGNLRNGLVGAMGEFQTAVIFQYAALKSPSKFLKTILTDTIEKSTLGKSDINLKFFLNDQLQRKIGIQSKNVADISGIDASAHPSEIDSYGFADCIINSYFNASNPQPSDSMVEEYVRTELPRLFHTDMSNNLGRDDVSFYMIQGLYLVPVSVILSNINENSKVAIDPPTSLYVGQDDESFKEREDGNAVLSKYWVYEKGSNRTKWIYRNGEGNKVWRALDTHTTYYLNNSINQGILGEYRLFTW